MNKAIRLARENERLRAEIDALTESRKKEILKNKADIEAYIRKNARLNIGGKDFKLDEIEYRQTYYYEDCPYTPNWLYSDKEINEKGKHRPYYISDTGWYSKPNWDKVFSDFEAKFGEPLIKYLPPIIHDKTD